MISELAMNTNSEMYREDYFYDPLLAGEKPQEGGNYNPTEESRRGMDKKRRKHLEKIQAEKDALDKKIDEFMATKEKVPPPRVMHDKSELSRADIYLPNVSVIAGGKHLLEKAVLKLVRGRKYGLVGRNGIGKTTLINALCRKELEKCPQNLHILQVEQEVEGDDMSVLQHVIECDVERLELLQEQIDLADTDTKDMEEYEKKEHSER